MLITSFSKKIVFKIKEEYLQAVEELMSAYCAKSDSAYPLTRLRKLFPLKTTTAYAFDSNWHEPFGVLFNNWANEDNSFWIYIETDEDLVNLQALVRLNYSSKNRDHKRAEELRDLFKNDGLTIKRAN